MDYFSFKTISEIEEGLGIDQTSLLALAKSRLCTAIRKTANRIKKSGITDSVYNDSRQYLLLH